MSHNKIKVGGQSPNTSGEISVSLNNLSDVVLSGSEEAKDVLRHNGTNFVDTQLAYSDLSGTPTIPSSSGDITSDHTGVNYTGALDASITAHLSGIDTALASAGGGSAPDVVTDSSGTNTTISTTTGIEEVHLINNGANAVTITLPSASTAGEGYKYQIKRLGTATVTIDPDGNEQIDNGGAGVAITLDVQFESVTIVSNNANWFII
tara:strand:- start:29334 stop:29954 length:621 start_codon:yes stop_codon:yes gene_type:complete